MMRLLATVRSVLFALVFYSGTLLIVLGGFVAAALGPRAIRSYPVYWAHYHHWCARLLLGIRPRVIGTLPDKPVIVAAKHESMYETIEMLRILDQPAVVLKRELADLPLFGWVARRFGVIPVDRTGSSTALRSMLRAANAAKKDGRSILIFPEGTRVPHGVKAPLRPGFAGLYRQLALPVVPVALDSGRIWPRSFVKYPGVITFRIGAPILPGIDRNEIEAAVHAAINDLDGSGSATPTAIAPPAPTPPGQ